MTGKRKPPCSSGCVVGSDYPLCSSLTSVQCCIIVSHPGEVVWWDLVTPCPRVLSLCTPAFRATHPKQMLYNLTPFYIFSPTLTVTRVVREIACYMKDFVTPCLECPVRPACGEPYLSQHGRALRFYPVSHCTKSSSIMV